MSVCSTVCNRTVYVFVCPCVLVHIYIRTCMYIVYIVHVCISVYIHMCACVFGCVCSTLCIMTVYVRMYLFVIMM